MSSSVKGRKKIGKKGKGCGRIGIFRSLLEGRRSRDFKKRQCFATPPEVSVELGAFFRAQIIGSE
jgi:hypothetical protein